MTPNSPAQVLTAQTTPPPPHILNHAPSTTLGLGVCHFRTEQQWLGQGNHEERERFCCPQEKCFCFFLTAELRLKNCIFLMYTIL